MALSEGKERNSACESVQTNLQEMFKKYRFISATAVHTNYQTGILFEYMTDGEFVDVDDAVDYVVGLLWEAREELRRKTTPYYTNLGEDKLEEIESLYTNCMKELGYDEDDVQYS